MKFPPAKFCSHIQVGISSISNVNGKTGKGAQIGANIMPAQPMIRAELCAVGCCGTEDSAGGESNRAWISQVQPAGLNRQKQETHTNLSYIHVYTHQHTHTHTCIYGYYAETHVHMCLSIHLSIYR